MTENQGRRPDLTAIIDGSIGRNIKALRERRGLSQAELASRLAELGVRGMHQTTIARLESGGRQLRASEAIAFARVLGTSVEDLAALEGESSIGVAFEDLRTAQRVFMQALHTLGVERMTLAGQLDDTCVWGGRPPTRDEILAQTTTNPDLILVADDVLALSELHHVRAGIEALVATYRDELGDATPTESRMASVLAGWKRALEEVSGADDADI
ncbi:helix-turn-helix transcriptional regulator [Microbacterium gorillae]|uniref:helix-turn-helix transcriptional regulator n=1 Tax=Microbacterium gorillae TaxID=1231063 RepID=UPI000693B199|nr:helix-turn-helix transcriptional regulator [Microbacterium gorillae]